MNIMHTHAHITHPIMHHVITHVWPDAHHDERIVHIIARTHAECHAACMITLSHDAARQLCHELHNEFSEWQHAAHEL